MSEDLLAVKAFIERYHGEVPDVADRIARAVADMSTLRTRVAELEDRSSEIKQILGMALGYPVAKDAINLGEDPEDAPVNVRDETEVSLSAQIVERVAELEAAQRLNNEQINTIYDAANRLILQGGGVGSGAQIEDEVNRIARETILEILERTKNPSPKGGE